MKKFFSVFAVFLLSSSLYAAQIQWGMGMSDGYVTIPSGNISDYTAYLCVGGGDAATEAYNELVAGTWTSESSVSNKQLQSDMGSPTNAFISNSGASEVSLPLGETSFYVVIYNQDNGYFTVSDVATGTVFDLLSPGPGASWTGDELIATSNGWQIFGGGTPIDPEVPEPTALALLALGVAGVALRRRVA